MRRDVRVKKSQRHKLIVIKRDGREIKLLTKVDTVQKKI